MIEELQAFLVNLVAGAVGTGIGYGARRAQEHRTKRRRERAVDAFFGPTDVRLSIVHSAVKNEARSRFDYPSCDIRAANKLRRLLEETGREERKDFFVGGFWDFAAGGEFENGLEESNIVVLGGPKRNDFFAKTAFAPGSRYRLTLSEGENRLRDLALNVDIPSEADDSAEGYDVALIASMPNPGQPLHTLTLVAGIHGTGTLGGCIHLCESSTLEELQRAKRQGRMERLLRVEYQGGPENIVRCRIVGQTPE